MENILKIFKHDFKKIVTNWAAILVIGGLMVLPSLYAWFNIKASWDPYSNTKGVKVAVTNLDSGYTLNGKEINIGKEMITQLKGNDNIGWQFVDEKTANEGVNSGKYYASILIPQNFSQNIASILDGNIKKPDIIYTVNEKKNAIAPKITAKGASSLQQEVNKSFIKATSEAVILEVQNIGQRLQDKKPEIDSFINILFQIDNNMGLFSKSIDSFSSASGSAVSALKDIQGAVPALSSLVDKGYAMNQNAQNFLLKSKESMLEVNISIRNQLDRLSETSSSINTNIKSLVSTIKTGSKDASLKIIDGTRNSCYTLVKITDNIIDVLNSLNSKLNSPAISSLVNGMNSLKGNINNMVDTLNRLYSAVESQNNNQVDELLTKLNNDSDKVHDAIKNIINIYDTTVSKNIASGVDALYSSMNDAINLLQSGSKALKPINGILTSTINGATSGTETLNLTKEIFNNSQKTIHDLATQLKGMSDDDKLNKVFDMLKESADKESEFLSNPVNLVTKEIYPVPNYGSAMAPFFTVLSLWVGALILVSLISTNVHEESGIENLKAYEVYIGRLLLFAVIALCQSLIVTTGDLVLLGVYCKAKIPFVLFGLYTSFVFSTIVYTLASLFGDIGKAFGVILLVLQISASGGTFPIEVTPPFFQFINPFLPFTYAIDAMRQAVGGITWYQFIDDACVLLIYFVVSLTIGIAGKRYCDKYIHKFMHKLSETKLIGH